MGGSDSLAGPARTRAQAFCLIFSCKPFQEVLCLNRTQVKHTYPHVSSGIPHNQEGDKQSSSGHGFQGHTAKGLSPICHSLWILHA